MGDFSALVSSTRVAFNEGRTLSPEWRMLQLKSLLRLLDENEAVFVESLGKDLRKPVQECIQLEVEYLRNDVRGCINNLASWMADEYVEKNLVTLLDSTLIHYDPLGVVLVMGAWNYPLQLSLAPIAGALSAGNCVIIKPSEVSPATAEAIAKLIPQYLDKDCVKVVLGGVEETTRLLAEQFDHIFFTGSTHVGKIIREAANKHLTPVTLELGGKSPVYIDSTANMELTARRLMWAKFINLGQTCIAPDYVLCTKEVQDRFVRACRALLAEWYGPDPQKSPHLCRIVNRRNYDRLAAMLAASTATVAIGGQTQPDDLFISPTILTDVEGRADSTMQTEIFGPLLPIVPVADIDAAIAFVRDGEKPLSMYIFSTDKAVHEAFKLRTSCGSMVMNDAIVHLSVETLPFGGVGASGMGRYHGRYTFTTFSHAKSILVRDFGAIGEYLGATRYPPYAAWKVARMQQLLKNRKLPIARMVALLPYLACILLGMAAVPVWQCIAALVLPK